MDADPTAALFTDRADAGRQLADALRARHLTDPLVLAIPRGGLPVAEPVARALSGDLDIVSARKVGAPDQPELAIGAVTADGGLFLDQALADEIGVTPAWLTEAIARERDEAKRRMQRFRGDAPPVAIAGRTVLIVDDGLATGATMQAAVRAVRRQQPARLIVAVPVGSRQAIEALAREADEVVCPIVPEPFWAVGYHYRDFPPVADDAVTAILAPWLAVRRPPPPEMPR